MTCGLLSGLLGGFHNNQVNTSANYYPNSGSSSGCTSNTQNNHFSAPNLNLFGGAQASGNNLINQLLGGIQGGGSHNAQTQGGQGNGILGSLFGGLATGVHHTAENLISATGLGGLFAPIDDAIIHPILWDPLSRVTGYDVSSHPNGVANVSNPLGVNR